ncbi:uncharacterized protein V6R79_008070 [Siganus canaliculatus]
MAAAGLFLWMFVLIRVAPSEFPAVGPRPVHAVVHDDVVLPCVLDPPFIPEDLTVDWTCGDRFVHVFRNGEDDDGDQDEQFRGRTSMFHGEMSRGNISLKLTNVTEEDSGLYSCHVPRLESQVKDGNVNLSVGDEHKTQDVSKDDKEQTMDYQTLAAVFSVVSALIILTLLFCLCKKKGIIKQPTRCRRRNQGNPQDVLVGPMPD